MPRKATAVRGQFSGDATAGSEIALTLMDGTARALAATETLEIYWMLVTMDAEDGVTTVFADADDDNVVDTGEILVIIRGNSIQAAYPCEFPFPISGAVGAKPHIINAGTTNLVSVSLLGQIVSHG